MDKIVQMSVGRPKDIAKRQRILDSAKTLFLKQGYAGSSMNQIAAEAGVSKLTVYNHFQDKATLFTAAIEETCTTLLYAHPLDFQHADDFKIYFEQLCTIALNMVCLPEAIKLEHLMLSLAAEQSPLVQQFYAASHGKMQSMWQHFFQQGLNLGCLKPCSVDELQQCITSLLFGTRHHDVLLGMRSLPDAGQQKDIVKHSMNLFLHQYSG